MTSPRRPLVLAVLAAALVGGAGLASAAPRLEPIPVPIIGQIDPDQPICVITTDENGGEHYLCVG